MPAAVYAGRSFDVDNEGFLLSMNGWTPEVGDAIAAEVGIALGPEHRKVIDFARADFASQGQTPGLRRITGQTGVSMKRIYELFPKGPAKLIARIAGVPKPKSCL